MFSTKDISRFEQLETPFYYYDLALLQATLAACASAAKVYNFHVHYAMKANFNQRVLEKIKATGFGADCVSGGEVKAALDAGFPANKVVYAGVGKSDWEINLALDNNIFCFNVESVPELEVINELARQKDKTVSVCFRINPDVGAHTHANITTGLAENKFGISIGEMEHVITLAKSMPNINFIGLHFHIGSQILEMNDFVALAERINELQDRLDKEGHKLKVINVGGGLGIDYDNPTINPIPNFKDYFSTYNKVLKLREGQSLHFELGRAVVGQCGTLISKVLYIKNGTNKKFAIIDAGMTDLIRPALYQAHHKIFNLSETEQYDVVGPICESSDVFDKSIELPITKRNDIIAICSAGAYGEIMASTYNCRKMPKGYISDEI